MASSKRSKKYSAVMSLASSKPRRAGFFLLTLAALSLAPFAGAETGIVSAVGTGKDVPEAIISLLRSAVGKYFGGGESAALARNVLQNEIIPNASAFVQSYRIVESGRGAVSLSANVDLDVIRALLILTPAQLGDSEGARAFVAVKGARLPEGAAVPAKPGGAVPNPYQVLETAAKDRFVRRQFTVATLGAEETQSLGAGEDVAAPELLRGLGAKAGARLALGISSRYESFENENSHNKEQRIVLTATLLDVKTGALLGRSSVNVSEPKSRKEQYAADLQRSLAEEGKDLFHDVLVSAGKKFFRGSEQEGFTLLRVQYPSNAQLVSKFRALLEANKAMKSVVEYSITRGAVDFAVRPAMKDAALAKVIKALSSEEINVTLVENAGQAEAKAPMVVVKLAPKEAPGANAQEIPNEKP